METMEITLTAPVVVTDMKKKVKDILMCVCKLSNKIKRSIATAVVDHNQAPVVFATVECCNECVVKCIQVFPFVVAGHYEIYLRHKAPYELCRGV